MSALNQLVTEAVDLVVHSERVGGRVQVSEVHAVEALQGGPEANQFTTTPVFERSGAGAPLVWTGHVPARLARAFTDAGHDVRGLLEAAGTSDGVMGGHGRRVTVGAYADAHPSLVTQHAAPIDDQRTGRPADGAP